MPHTSSDKALDSLTLGNAGVEGTESFPPQAEVPSNNSLITHTHSVEKSLCVCQQIGGESPQHFP